jgi:hypothetical protein
MELVHFYFYSSFPDLQALNPLLSARFGQDKYQLEGSNSATDSAIFIFYLIVQYSTN